MPATVEEVEQLIQEGFPGSEAEVTEKNHRVVGTIFWDQFQGKDPGERNRLVTRMVRDPLGYKGINIGFLLPLASKDEG